jgi:hypothetical protein
MAAIKGVTILKWSKPEQEDIIEGDNPIFPAGM